MNKRTRAIDEDTFKLIIVTMKNGKDALERVQVIGQSIFCIG